MIQLTPEQESLVARMERGLAHLDKNREKWADLPETDREIQRGKVGSHVLNDLPALVEIIRSTTAAALPTERPHEN